MVDEEQRRYLRTDKAVDIIINDNITGWTNNLGLGGISAFVRGKLNLFEDIKITLSLPNMTLRLNGQCLRIDELESNFFNVAISFQNIQKETRNVMISFINLG